MNASFRTAFWALCLSLGVPLAMFVGAELFATHSPAAQIAAQPKKRESRSTPAVLSSELEPADDSETRTADSGASQVRRLPAVAVSRAKPVAAKPDSKPDPLPPSSPVAIQASESAAVRQLRPAPVSSDRIPESVVLRPHTGQVQLGPHLETDDPQTAASQTPRNPTVASRDGNPVRLERPERLDGPARLDGTDPPPPSQAAATSRAIDARLARLQQNLDQLAQVQQQQQVDQLQQSTQLLQQLQQTNQLDQIDRETRNRRSALQGVTSPDGADADADEGKTKRKKRKGSEDEADDPKSDDPDEMDAKEKEDPAGRKRPGKRRTKEGEATDDEAPETPAILKASPAEDGSERFSLQIKDAEIAQVLDMIGQLSGKNILTTPEVTGKVSANLHNVDIEQALKAILRAGGFVFEQEGDFVYVSTQEEADAKATLSRKILVKVYRPNYISVKEVKILVTPILTPRIGKISVTDPSEVGIATGSTAAGGDSLAQRDALLVQDYAEVLLEIDRILLEMDIPAMQVVIDAKILKVTLTDSLEFGINFALINKAANNQLVVSGNGATLFNTSGAPGGSGASIIPPMGQFIADTAGLKYGFIRGDISGFLNALESIADTNLIASPQLMVLNKQRAELIIGTRLPYKTLAFNGTQTAENVNFLDAGTKLRIRPFIAPDGLVRMEIHPERSTATQDASTKLPVLSTTEVTSNVMIRDGNTLVVGGLIEEEVVEAYERIPFLGALPIVGPFFRNKNESIVRSELIILITPRIVEQTAGGIQGTTVKIENERRADHFRNNLTSLNRRNLARMQYDQALYHFEHGNLIRAREFVMRCLHYSKNDIQALELKDQIESRMRAQTFPWTAPSAASESFLNPPGKEMPQAEPLPAPGVDPPPAGAPPLAPAPAAAR